MKLLLIPFHLRALVLLPAMLLAFPPAAAADETPAPAANNATLEEALKKLKLPGVEINLKEKCVDVASTVCLGQGALELIACTKDTKEHEAIIMIEAVPKHVHTALLLIGARPGSPATLVFPDKEGKIVERPISDFIVANDDESNPAAQGDKQERFPTNTFLFAGSILHGEKDGPRQYLCDTSGNVISIATFGDELLCLSGVHDEANGHLMWQIDNTHLPAVGTKVTLRLRPQFQAKPAPGKIAE